MEAPRIDVGEAHRKVSASEALLVCAYDDDTKCGASGLPGAIALTQLQAQESSVPRNKELIFYCA